MFRRFFALLAACIVLFCVSVPVFAAELVAPVAPTSSVQLGVDVVSFADALVHNGIGTVNFFRSFLDDDVCPECPHLHGQHNFLPKRTKIDGKVSVYYVCEYCGESAGEVMEDAYQDYVGTLPGTQYNSNGAFLWKPSFSDIVDSSGHERSSVRFYYASGSSTSTVSLNGNRSTVAGVTIYVLPENRSFVLVQGNGHSSIGVYSDVYFKAPWDAFYVSTGDAAWSRHYNGAFSIGALFGLGDSLRSTESLYVIELPSFYVTPFSFSSQFASDTRVSAKNDDGTGLYGYMDNGTLVQSAADTIFTESGNVYTNPVTNETKNITSWDYDYTDRSYTLTTNEGDTVTVAYGDTNVTINEGAETYNVYYLVEHDDSVPCDHTYTSQITQSPTCTAGGVKTYTCSICGDTYTEAILATGHSYSSEVTREPTCTASGVRTSTCSVCGDMHTETIAATGHSYVSSVTQEPTCTASGVRTSTCSVCGDVRTEAISATGHSYSSSVTMEPTCIGTGVRTFVCSVCGDTYTVSISATGHRWRLVRQEPTVYDETGQLVTAGYTLYQCDTCGEQYRLAAESGGTALPFPAPDSATTSGDTEIDSSVGRGFLATIAHGLTEDLPEVLRSFSTWFVEFPQFYSGFATFLKDGIFVCLPIECQRLIGFGFGMVTAVGIVRKIIGR